MNEHTSPATGDDPVAVLAQARAAWDRCDFGALLKHGSAAAVLARSIADVQAQHTAAYLLGHAYRAQMRLGEARVHFTRALRLAESTPALAHERARAHHDLFATLAGTGSRNTAEAHFRYAVRAYSETDPFRLALRKDRAFYLLHAGQYADALATVQRARGEMGGSEPFRRSLDGLYVASLASAGEADARLELTALRGGIDGGWCSGGETYFAAHAAAALGKRRVAERLAGQARRIGVESGDVMLQTYARALTRRISGPR